MKRLQVRILSTIHFGLSCSKAGRKTFAMFLEGFDSLTVHIRFVGVTANISDCLSDSMSSILIRTAVDHAAYALMVVLRSTKSEESVRITHAAPFAG